MLRHEFLKNLLLLHLFACWKAHGLLSLIKLQGNRRRQQNQKSKEDPTDITVTQTKKKEEERKNLELKSHSVNTVRTSSKGFLVK